VIIGTFTANDAEDDVDSPVERSVTPIFPLLLGHPAGGLARICVPLTEITTPCEPPNVTMRGATKPWPVIVTVVLASPWSGVKPKIERPTVYVKDTGPLVQVDPAQLTSFTVTPTVWGNVCCGPSPLAGGVIAMIWVGLTDSTCASSVPPKKTWTGAEKPLPVIVTRVPPTFVPEEGRIAEMIGFESLVNVKQAGDTRVWPAMSTSISTGVAGSPASSGNAGVDAVIVVPPPPIVPMAWWTTEPERKMTGTVVPSVPSPPPVMVIGVPPDTGPVCGLAQTEMKVVLIPLDWNVTCVERRSVFGPTVTLPVMVAGPTRLLQTAVWTEPFWVTSEIV